MMYDHSKDRRIAELVAENSLLTDALANYEQENARLRGEVVCLRAERDEIARLAGKALSEIINSAALERKQ